MKKLLHLRYGAGAKPYREERTSGVQFTTDRGAVISTYTFFNAILTEAPKKEIIPFFRTGCKTEATACAAFTLENRSGCSHCIFTRNPLYLFLEKKAA